MSKNKKQLAYVLAAAGLIVAAFFVFGVDGEGSRSGDTARYVNLVFGIELEHPAGWVADEEYGETGVPLHKSGEGGYFGVDAVGAVEVEGATGEVPIDDVVSGLVLQNPDQPYGSEPEIRNADSGELQARLILPSADQPEGANSEAAFLARYPEPMQIGEYRYLFLLIYAHKDYIEQIANTLKISGRTE